MVATACGRAPVLQIDEPFKPYVQRFEQLSIERGNGVQIVDLKVSFGKMQSEYENGACEIIGDNTPTVYINEVTWNRLTDIDREALIFHELGHCVLRRGHIDEIEEDGSPKSLMHPYRIQTRIYEMHEQKYVVELFKGKAEF